MTKAQKNGQAFEGFSLPQYTQTPNVIIDFIMPDVSGNEFKVLMYIARRTLGFHKTSDAISINQLVNGITTRRGEILNKGTGLSQATVKRVLNSLEEQGYITRTRISDEKRGHQPTKYTLKFKDTPLAQNEPRGVAQNELRGLAQNEPYKRNDIQKKQQQKKRNETKKEKNLKEANASVVVVDLLKNQKIGSNQIQGLIKSAGEQVGRRHNAGEGELTLENYIEEKINYRDYEISARPQNVRNKTAWLISAIKQDFEKPEGYQSEAEIVAERGAEEKRLQEAEESQKAYQEQLNKAQEEQAQEDERKAEALRQAYARWGTAEAVQEQWVQAREDAKTLLATGHRITIGRSLDRVHFLGTEKNKVHLFADTDDLQTVRNYLIPSLTQAVKYLGIDVPRGTRIEFELITENDMEKQTG